MLEDLQTHCLKKAMPPEIRKLGRTLKEWFDKISTITWHESPTHRPKHSTTSSSASSTSASASGTENYRIRALLYAGKPNWRVLGSIVVR